VDIATKQRHFATHLELLDVANLLDHAVALRNLPVLIVRLLESVVKISIRLRLRIYN
jgi:hypothetical protein